MSVKKTTAIKKNGASPEFIHAKTVYTTFIAEE